jgi:hypothetical protein
MCSSDAAYNQAATAAVRASLRVTTAEIDHHAIDAGVDLWMRSRQA